MVPLLPRGGHARPPAGSTLGPHTPRCADRRHRDATAAAQLQEAIDAARPGGIMMETLPDDGAARAAVLDNELAAAVTAAPDQEILLASGTGKGRSAYVSELLTDIIDAPTNDILPTAAGDASGSGLFLLALPIAIVGMVSTIMARQLIGWPYLRRCTVIAGIGIFTGLAGPTIATWQQIIPATTQSWLIIPGTAVFVTALRWTITGAAEFIRQYPLPFAITFVPVLGAPTAGTLVTPDMIPGALTALHQVLPMGQFINLLRSLSLNVGSPLYPTAVLLAWLAIGAAPCALAHRRSMHVHTMISTAPTPPETPAHQR